MFYYGNESAAEFTLNTLDLLMIGKYPEYDQCRFSVSSSISGEALNISNVKTPSSGNSFIYKYQLHLVCDVLTALCISNQQVLCLQIKN